VLKGEELMVADARTDDVAPARRVLDRLIHAKGIERYGLFFVADEGEFAADDSGASSGFLVDQSGRVFYFVVNWSPGQRNGVLTRWQEVPVEPHWQHDSEYTTARASAGLDAA
jgi:hypothetical protein